MDYGPIYRNAMAQGGGIGVQGPMAIANYQAQLQRNDPAKQLQMLQIMQQIKDSQNQAQLQNFKIQQYIRGQQDTDASARAFASMMTPGMMGDAPQAPAPGQPSMPMTDPSAASGMPQQPQGFASAAPAAQQGMAGQAYGSMMMRPQQAPQAAPMVAPVPHAAAQGFMSDPRVLSMVAYAKNARLSPGAVQKAIMDYFPIWQAEQSAKTKGESFDALNAYRLGSLERRDKSLELRESSLEGAWGGAPQGIEDNPLNIEDKEKYLSTLPADVQQQVKAIANNEAAPPTANQMKNNPGLQKTMAAVYSYKPEFKPQGYAVLQSFRSPDKPTGKAMNAFDTAIQHIDVVEEAASELKNGTFKPTNAIAQKIASITGEAAPDGFDAVKQFVVNEVLRASAGNALALSDRQELETALNKTQSPAQMAAVLSRFRQLMSGRLLSYQQQYVNGTGRDDFATILSPRSREVFGGVLGGKTQAGPTQQAVPTAGGGVQFLGFE